MRGVLLTTQRSLWRFSSRLTALPSKLPVADVVVGGAVGLSDLRCGHAFGQASGNLGFGRRQPEHALQCKAVESTHPLRVEKCGQDLGSFAECTKCLARHQH